MKKLYSLGACCLLASSLFAANVEIKGGDKATINLNQIEQNSVDIAVLKQAVEQLILRDNTTTPKLEAKKVRADTSKTQLLAPLQAKSAKFVGDDLIVDFNRAIVAGEMKIATDRFGNNYVKTYRFNASINSTSLNKNTSKKDNIALDVKGDNGFDVTFRSPTASNKHNFAGRLNGTSIIFGYQKALPVTAPTSTIVAPQINVTAPNTSVTDVDGLGCNCTGRTNRTGHFTTKGQK